MKKGERIFDEIGQFATFPQALFAWIPELGTDPFVAYIYLRWKCHGRDAAQVDYEAVGRDLSWRRERFKKAVDALIRVGLAERKKAFGQAATYVLTKKLLEPVDMAVMGISLPTRGRMESSAVVRPADDSLPTPVASVVRPADDSTSDLKDSDLKDSDLRTSEAQALPARPHPALAAFRDIMHQWPHRSLRGDIETAIGEETEGIVRWRGHLKDWLSRGFSPKNIAGILETWRSGGIKDRRAGKRDPIDAYFDGKHG